MVMDGPGRLAERTCWNWFELRDMNGWLEWLEGGRKCGSRKTSNKIWAMWDQGRYGRKVCVGGTGGGRGRKEMSVPTEGLGDIPDLEGGPPNLLQDQVCLVRSVEWPL